MLAARFGAVLALAVSCSAAAEVPGLREITVSSAERDQAVLASVWYPTSVTVGDQALVGDNAVFQGTPALLDAPIADARLPLILITHGGFRAALKIAICRVQAERGFDPDR